MDINYSEKLKQIHQTMNIWKSRILTPFGRNVLLKTLLLSTLNHLFAALPNPTEYTMDKLQKMCFNFIWQGKPDKVKREVVTCIPKHGGINVPKIKEIIAAQKLSWMRKLMLNTSKWTNLFFQNIENQDLFWLADSQYIITRVIPKFTNSFWKDVLDSWAFYNKMFKNNIVHEIDLQTQCLWNNNDITIDNKPIMYVNWYKNGVVYVNDIIHKDGRFVTLQEFTDAYSVAPSFLTYEGVKQAVTSYININNTILYGLQS